MQSFFRKADSLFSRVWLPLTAVCIFVVAAFYGIERIFNVDFVCTNGDYQNYNVLRRFLDGQIPYHDFANYLGMGLLALCAPLLALHNTFAGSLFVTNFVAAAAFMLFVMLIFYLVTGSKYISTLAGLIFPKLLTSGVLLEFIPVFGYYTDYHLGLMARPMNSFRIGRMFWVIFLCFAALLWLHRKAARNTLRSPDSLHRLLASPRGSAVIGFILGLGVTWSNDFGFACIGSAMLVQIILATVDCFQLRSWKKAFSRFLGFIPALPAGMLLSILIASRGHLGSWLDFTTGVSSWQYWYYGENMGDKLPAAVDIFTSSTTRRSWIHFVIFFLCMGWCLYRLCKKKAGNRTILFVFLFVSVVATHFLYILGSGHDKFFEQTYDLVILLFWAIVTQGILWIVKKLAVPKHSGTDCDHCPLWMNLSVICLTLLYTLYIGLQDLSLLQQYHALAPSEQENYVEQLEGIHSDAKALEEMYDIVGQDSMFATFATALDDMRGTFQPSGCDYVIHALGDNRYEAYIDNFRNGKYQWVQTTNTNVWPWEKWISRASWELYREIYSDYSLRSDHAFWTLWQYAGEDVHVLNTEVQLSTEKLSENQYRLTVTGDSALNCYVDVSFSWDTAVSARTEPPLTWKRLIFIEDEAISRYGGFFSGYFLRSSGTDKSIPIYMENGMGSVVISTVPYGANQLDIYDVRINEIIEAQR